MQLSWEVTWVLFRALCPQSRCWLCFNVCAMPTGSMCNCVLCFVQLSFVFCAAIFCVLCNCLLCFVLVQLCRELAGWQQRWMRSHTVCPYWQYCCTKHKTHLHICCTLHTLAQSNSTQTQSILSHVTQWWFIILHLPPNELKSFDRRIIHCARILQSMDSINIRIW